MPFSVSHVKTSLVPDSTDTSIVRPSDWNSNHAVTFLNDGSEVIRFVGVPGASVSTGNVVFSNFNNVTFGMAGSVVTASASLPGGAGDGGNILAAGTQTANTTGTVAFQNGNNVTFGMSNSSVVTASASFPAQTVQTQNMVSVQGSTGDIRFNNANNITFGFNASTVTASASFAQTAQPGIQSASAGTTRITTGEIVFGNSNGLAFGANGQTITASYTVPNVPAQTNQTAGLYAVGNTTGQSSSSTFDVRTVSFSGAGNVSVGYSAGNVVISGAGGGAGDGYNIIAAGTQTANTTGTVLFRDSNGVSFGLSNNSQITATVKTDYALSNHSHGNPTLALTNISGTTNSASNGFTLSLSAAAPGGGGAINVIAGITNGNLQTIQFNDSNNISFGLNGSTITASINLINAGISTGGNTSGNTGTIEGGQIIFAGVNGITLSGSVNGVSQTISISGLSDSQMSYWDNAVQGQANSTWVGKVAQQNTLWVVPFNPQNRRWEANMTVSTFNLLISASGATSAISAAHTSNFSIGIYRLINGLSVSLIDSVVSQITMGVNAANNTAWNGIRFLTVHSSQWSSQPVLLQNETYYLGLLVSSAGTSNGTLSFLGQYAWATNPHSGTIGRSNSGLGTSQGFYPILGHYSVTTGAFPSTIHQSELNKQTASANFIPFLLFNNRTGVV